MTIYNNKQYISSEEMFNLMWHNSVMFVPSSTYLCVDIRSAPFNYTNSNPSPSLEFFFLTIHRFY